ncbi:MAG: LamG domain-containing protein [Candidatus Euphemobacter frigidus]|nr:LamG domain-containing protein [Candidatus Euphemobacter frigidus]MDP8274883.1 LamG domain-containing protein [Candidatus Euphemobacter frigidus]
MSPAKKYQSLLFPSGPENAIRGFFGLREKRGKIAAILFPVFIGSVILLPPGMAGDVSFHAHYNLDYRTVEGVEPSRAEGLSLTDGVVSIPTGEPVRGVLVDEGDWMEYDFPPGFNLEEGTVEFWFQPHWNSGEHPQETFSFLRTRPFHGNGFCMSKDGANNYRFFISSPTGESGVAYGVGSQLKENNWYYMTATWNPDEICLYLNGEPVDSEGENKNRPTAAPQILCIGHSESGGQEVKGVIDEFKISSFAKSRDEIRLSMMEDLAYTSIKARPLPVIRPGESRPLTAMAYSPALGYWLYVVRGAEWLIDDPSIAAVDPEDNLTGLNVGETSLRAAFSGQTSPPVTVRVNVRNRAVFLIDRTVYPDIAELVVRYKADVENALPFELIIDSDRDLEAMTPEALRGILQDYHYREGVEGAVLAGHVPYALWEEGWTDWYTQSRGVACVLYYEDLDGEFTDETSPENPAFTNLETAESFPGPEIWTGWMYPNAIDPAEDAVKLSHLLNKTHAYYSGEVVGEKVAVEMSHHDEHWGIANFNLPSLAPEDGSFFPASDVEHYGLMTDIEGNPVPTRPLKRHLVNPPDIPIELHRELFEELWDTRDYLVHHLHCHGHAYLLWLPQTVPDPREGITRDFFDTLNRGPLLFCVTACSNGVFNHRPHDSVILAAPFSPANTITAHGFVTGPNFSRDFAVFFDSLARGRTVGRAHYDAMMVEPVSSSPRIPIVVGDPFLTINPYEPSPLPFEQYREMGDYNGDGISDIGIFRNSSGLWAVRDITRCYFGQEGDLPVSGDYNGDATTEIGIFSPSGCFWAIRGLTRFYFGGEEDTPVPADYNGDGYCDPGIFRSTSGLWAIRGVTRIYFGALGDRPVPGYYDGNTSKDIGIFRSLSGLWAIRGVSRIYFGSSLDNVVPGDYDGNGTWEAGIFRSSSGLWAIRGITRSYFGSTDDRPVPADYDGDSSDDIGIFRDFPGLWAIRNLSRVYFGSSGDIPVTR